MRPTGRLHIGNYFGALQNWVKLQDDPSNECFFFIADWHSLTSDYADTSQIAQNTIEIATDFLAAGLDPHRSTIFQQSQILEHAELHLLLSMVTPRPILADLPTYKEQIENIRDKELDTYGFLGYPVVMTSDIVMYGADPEQKPDIPLVVPVGEDQIPHVELSREIVRRFGFYYGFTIDEGLFAEEVKPLLHAETITGIFEDESIPEKGVAYTDKQKEDIRSLFRNHRRQVGRKNFYEWMRVPELNRFFRETGVLCEPEHLLTKTPRVPGTDGRKMSKSYRNAIELGESDESIRVKTKAMITDPARKRRTDPGNPDICPVYDWHKLFSPAETLSWANVGCRTAGIGCIECKSAMADNLIKWIAPIRARREECAAHPARVLEIIDAGSEQARRTAQATMARVREAVFGWKAKRESISGSAGTSDAKQRGAGD